MRAGRRRSSLLLHPEMALLARIFVYWAGGTWYPGTAPIPEIVSRDDLADAIEEITGASPEPALKVIEKLGERVREDGVADSIPVYLGDALGTALPARGARPQPGRPRPDRTLLDLDFSTLASYSECGYRYRLRHLCGFQSPIAPELGFGRVLHHVVAELARAAPAAGPPDDRAVISVIERAWYLPFAGAIPAANLRASAIRRLIAYAHGHGAELTRTLTPEARFEVPIAGSRIRGRIDLLLQAAPGASRQVEIVDFKTTANRPDPALHHNQLRLYATAMAKTGYEPVRLAIHDLEPGDRIEVATSLAAQTDFEEQLGRWVDGIRSGVFEPNPDSCRHCDFAAFYPHAAHAPHAPAPPAPPAPHAPPGPGVAGTRNRIV